MNSEQPKLPIYIAIIVAILLIGTGAYFILHAEKIRPVQAQETHSNSRLELVYTQHIGQWHDINIYHDKDTGYNCYESVYQGDAVSTGVGFSCVKQNNT